MSCEDMRPQHRAVAKQKCLAKGKGYKFINCECKKYGLQQSYRDIKQPEKGRFQESIKPLEKKRYQQSYRDIKRN